MTEPVAILEKPIAAAQVLAAVRTVAAR